MLVSWLITTSTRYNLLVTTGISILVIGLQIWELIYWLQKMNRVIVMFFDSLNHGDFNANFDRNTSGSTPGILLKEMNRYLDIQAERNAKLGSRIGFLEMLVEHLPTGILCWGQRDLIVFQNPAAIELIGIGAELTWSQFLVNNPSIDKLLKDSGGQNSEVYVNSLSGKDKLIKIEVWPFTILGENVKVMTLEDITSELEQKEVEAWQKLLRVLSHEIRNSITTVSSLTETISAILNPIGNADSEINLTEQNVKDIIQAINIIKDRTVKLGVFTENVLKVTRIPTPVKELLPAKEILERIISFLKGDLEREHIAITLRDIQNDLMVFADPVQLELMLTNLIKNSILALRGRDNSAILINISQTNGVKTIVVEDNGIGIKRANLDKIFMPFFTTSKGGHGLGLSIVRQMMELHNGSISCESEPNELTRFILEFPNQK